jgi:riboflavin kinase / FMN adenylyltransferase
MILETSYSTHFNHTPLAISVGNFDGVHRGHQAILVRLAELAQRDKLRPAVLTFTNHPLALVDPTRIPPLLSTIAERMGLIAAYKVSKVIMLPFDRRMANYTPESFLRDFLRDTLNVRLVVMGHDHTFGKNRSGDRTLVDQLAPGLGLKVEHVPALLAGEKPISSSAVRKALAKGDVKLAAELFGYNYCISAEVMMGRREGRFLGFPTANLADTAKLVPPPGVYAGWAWLGRERLAAAINISFPNGQRGADGRCDASCKPVVEAHILDFNRDIYGKRIKLEFISQVREEIHFPDRQALIEQIKEDVNVVRELFPRISGV